MRRCQDSQHQPARADLRGMIRKGHDARHRAGSPQLQEHLVVDASDLGQRRHRLLRHDQRQTKAMAGARHRKQPLRMKETVAGKGADDQRRRGLQPQDRVLRSTACTSAMMRGTRRNWRSALHWRPHHRHPPRGQQIAKQLVPDRSPRFRFKG